jgi:hypothetical protein
MRRYYLFFLLISSPFFSFSQSTSKSDSSKFIRNSGVACVFYTDIQDFSHKAAITSGLYYQPSDKFDRDFSLPFQQLMNSKDCHSFTTTGSGYVLYGLSAKNNDTIAYHDYIFKNSQAMIHGGMFNANMFPLFGGDYGPAGQHDYYGGIHADGFIRRFSYSVNYIGGYLNGPSYLDSIIKNDKVVPGMGYAYGNPAKGYSYQYWDGYVSYYLNNIFNFEIGKGKQFWGDGYRSLILSDVSNSYPYFKITTTVWHIQYTNLFTVMQDIEPNTTQSKNFPIKYGTFHFLSWNVSKRINLSLFEAVIGAGDHGNYSRGFDPNYLNPVIFYRPIEFSLGSPDNELVGGTFKIKIAKNNVFYGQVLLDEFVLHNVIAHNGWWGNKQGVQGGVKLFNLFGSNGLSFQTEVDYVRPYTYSEGSPQENYSNAGQPLADPMGANFVESASFLTWFYKNLIIQGNIEVYHFGLDPTGIDPATKTAYDYGQNIFISYDDRVSEYGNYVGQGVSSYLAIIGLRGAYIISPKMGLKAELGMTERLEKEGVGKIISSPYIYFGIKTSLGNLYNDF